MAKQTGERLALLAGVLLVLLSAVSARANDTPAAKGKILFDQKCSPCHALGGGDRPTGPDLAGVTTRTDRQWLARFILAPSKMFAAGDPAAMKLLQKFNNLRMPDLGLSRTQVDAVLSYLVTTAKGSETKGQTGASVPQGATGDAQTGEALFVGSVPFARGGSPCLACHGVAGTGLGLAAGASYGPDLTSLWDDYGADGVTSILKSLPFPAMQPIFAKRPLTDSERADLSAFFRRVNGRQPVHIQGALMWQVASGVIILLIFAAFFGRGRLRTVRLSLVAQAQSRKGETR